MITHFVPQWLLERFRIPDRPLKELNVSTGNIADRKVRRAGSGVDLWAEDLERGLMGTHDNDAARVFRNHIVGRRRIQLKQREQRIFAMWLALFMPRVPRVTEKISAFIREHDEDPTKAVKIVYSERQAVLDEMKRTDPQAFEKKISELGDELGRDVLVAWAAHLVETKSIKYLPSLKDTYDQHLRSIAPADYAKILCRYHWRWLYTDHGFVIGDNPLVSGHDAAQRFDFGIGKSEVEVSIPLGTHLGLWLTRGRRHDDGRLTIAHASRLTNSIVASVSPPQVVSTVKQMSCSANTSRHG